MTKKEIYQKAVALVGQRRQQALITGEKHRQEALRRNPQIKHLEEQRAQTVIAFCKQAFSNAENKEHVFTAMKAKNIELQMQIGEALFSQGLPQDYLEPRYTCSHCQDTGVCQTEKGQAERCTCLIQLIRQIGTQEFNRLSGMPDCSFADFSLLYYRGKAEEEKMTDVFEFCKDYAAQFSPSVQSVLMVGNTGLGKTHLSISIAKEVLKHGYHAMYITAYDLFLRLQQEQFGKGEANQNTQKDVLTAELLIIDDLGTEQKGSIQMAAVFHLINSRMQASKPMIISTNLSFKELEQRYGDRVASRLATLCHCLFFCGTDVRQLRLMNAQASEPVST